LTYGWFLVEIKLSCNKNKREKLEITKQHNMLNHHKLMNHFFAADTQSFARMAMKPGTSPVFSVIITQARMSNSSTTKVCLKKNLKCWKALSFFFTAYLAISQASWFNSVTDC
jgi:hypothetical protein